MKNYSAKIALGNNKFAYEQTAASRIEGERISHVIRSRWQIPSSYYHLRKGGHVAALKKHSGSHLFTRLDIERFFYQVNKTKILRCLKKIGLTFSDANDIAYASVIMENGKSFLPYGFTQSPLIASLCLNFSSAGRFVQFLDKNIIVSIYVDDIILSTRSNERALREATRHLIERLHESHFPISSDKISICEKTVESFNVNLSNRNLSVTPDRIEQFKEQIRRSLSNPYALRGIEEYVSSINTTQADDIREYIRNLSGRSTV